MNTNETRSATPGEPETEAGRRVLAALRRLDAAQPRVAKEAPIDWATPLWLIEAEARAESSAEMERLRAALEDIRSLFTNDNIRPGTFAVQAGSIAVAALRETSDDR